MTTRDRWWILTGLAMVAGLGGCEKKLGPAEAARQFIREIQTGNAREAYDSATFVFQAQQSFEFFAQTTQEVGLTELALADFSQPSVEDGTARINANFQTKNGDQFSLNMVLIQERGAWRVFSMKSPRSLQTGLIENKFSVVGKGPGFVDPVNRQAPPNEDEIRKMALRAMLDFNDAIRQKSFEGFYETIAMAWKKQISADSLQRAFQPFIDKDIDISSVQGTEFIFERKPEVNTEGLLIVFGHYPTQPYEVLIELKFMYEVPKWRLFGIDVKLTK